MDEVVAEAKEEEAAAAVEAKQAKEVGMEGEYAVAYAALVAEHAALKGEVAKLRAGGAGAGGGDAGVVGLARVRGIQVKRRQRVCGHTLMNGT